MSYIGSFYLSQSTHTLHALLSVSSIRPLWSGCYVRSNFIPPVLIDFSTYQLQTTVSKFFFFAIINHQPSTINTWRGVASFLHLLVHVVILLTTALVALCACWDVAERNLLSQMVSARLTVISERTPNHNAHPLTRSITTQSQMQITTITAKIVINHTDWLTAAHEKTHKDTDNFLCQYI
jgi:hypothetical protein